MTTSIIIPLNNRSTVKNLELRYALRSIEKYLNGYGQVFIVGELPEWVNKDLVIHIPKEDDPRNRFRDRNICEKITLACKDKRISHDALMWHDDHFLLEEIEASKFPYVHHGTMNPGPGQYGNTKKNTMALFGQNINDYDSHCPILFNKNKFITASGSIDWSKWYGYCLKTVYCIWNGIEGEYYPDLKIRWMETKEEMRAAIAGRKWFSIGDRCWDNGQMKELLEELYPEPSKYEL